MIKDVIFDGKVERYSTENFSHQFEVKLDWDGHFKCEALWANRIITSSKGTTRIEAIQNALNDLQQTYYKLPFATYRMTDILTGQL